MEELVKVRIPDGHEIIFEDVDAPEICKESGRLYISQEGRDIAVFNNSGWVFYGRPELPKEEEEPPVDIATTGSISDLFEDDDDDDDDF